LELSLRDALDVSEPFWASPLEKRFGVGTSEGAYRHNLMYIAARLMSRDNPRDSQTHHTIANWLAANSPAKWA